eukprot:5125325-Amphidinium_carterae.1
MAHWAFIQTSPTLRFASRHKRGYKHEPFQTLSQGRTLFLWSVALHTFLAVWIGYPPGPYGMYPPGGMPGQMHC